MSSLTNRYQVKVHIQIHIHKPTRTHIYNVFYTLTHARIYTHDAKPTDITPAPTHRHILTYLQTYIDTHAYTCTTLKTQADTTYTQKFTCMYKHGYILHITDVYIQLYICTCKYRQVCIGYQCNGDTLKEKKKKTNNKVNNKNSNGNTRRIEPEKRKKREKENRKGGKKRKNRH